MVLRVYSDHTICFLKSTFKTVLWAVPTALSLKLRLTLCSPLYYFPSVWVPPQNPSQLAVGPLCIGLSQRNPEQNPVGATCSPLGLFQRNFSLHLSTFSFFLFFFFLPSPKTRTSLLGLFWLFPPCATVKETAASARDLPWCCCYSSVTQCGLC